MCGNKALVSDLACESKREDRERERERDTEIERDT
jgi:hypothetical protein